jgi:hypothetical protein
MPPIITIRSENPDSRYLASSARPPARSPSLLPIAASAIFHPLASFQMPQERLSLRPSKYLLYIVYPDAEHGLTAQGSRHSDFPKHLHHEGAQAAVAMPMLCLACMENTTKFLFWPYLYLVEAMHPEPPSG